LTLGCESPAKRLPCEQAGTSIPPASWSSVAGLSRSLLAVARRKLSRVFLVTASDWRRGLVHRVVQPLTDARIAVEVYRAASQSRP